MNELEIIKIKSVLDLADTKCGADAKLSVRTNISVNLKNFLIRK